MSKQNAILCASLLVSYVFLHNYLNIFFEDDSWTMSNAWNYINLGLDKDVLFLDQDGSFTGQLFGKLYFYFSGTFLNLFGWTKSNVYLFNSVIIFITAYLWYLILGHLPFSNAIRNTLPLTIPLFPPFFFAAHTGRTDAFTILLMSLGFLLFIRKYYLAAGLVGILAMETHLMGAITFFYYLAYFIHDRIDIKKLTSYTYLKTLAKESQAVVFPSLAGIAIGSAVYVGLHHETFIFAELSDIVRSKMDMFSPINNYILSYFFDFDWIHHLPELGLLITAVFLYSKNKLYRENKFLFILMMVLVVSTFVTRRENRNYFIYIAPAVLLFYFYTFEALKKNKTLFASLLLVCTAYLGSLYYNHKDFQFSEFISFVKENTKEDIPVVGNPDVWFAAQEKEYYPIHNARDFNKIHLDEFYLVETDYLAKRIRVYNDVKENIYLNHDCQKIAEWPTFDNNSAAVCHCVANGKTKVPINHKPYPGWRKVMKQYMPDFLVTIN